MDDILYDFILILYDFERSDQYFNVSIFNIQFFSLRVGSIEL